MSLTETIETAHGPGPVGPYSQAVKVGGMVFVSGQIALDPRTQKIIEGGVAAQTARCLLNVEAILRSSGFSLEKVVRCVVFVAGRDRAADVDAAYSSFFPAGGPSRTVVAVDAMPRGSLVEIEATAGA